MRELKLLAVMLGMTLVACQMPRFGAAPAASAEDTAAEGSESTADAAAESAPAKPGQKGTRPGSASSVGGTAVDGTAAAPQRASAPARRETKPEPTPEPVVLPAGTELVVSLEGSYSSATNTVGDAVLARLADDVSVGGRVALPAGTEVRGSVTGAARSGRTKGKARLALGFDRLVVDGSNRDIAASGIDVTADDSKGRDAALIGGGAGAGAVVGGIAKGGKGAAIGGLIGGAAGTAAVLTTRGKEVEFPAGTQIRIVLQGPLQLR